MAFASVLNRNDPHQRTIIHVDMDYFYAQVEEIRDPSLRSRPLGIQQKNIIVTSNYIARKAGVQKLMLLSDAQRICPELVLVLGEDLTPYRKMSQKIFDILINYTPAVEKLGFDECYMDVSALVESRQQEIHLKNHKNNILFNCEEEIIGHIYPPDNRNLNSCNCGCAKRLIIGTQIANEIREELQSQLGITCCAGISFNKLLAKLVGAKNKPNQQTVLMSTYAEEFMRELHDLDRITGIGAKTKCHLLDSGITTVQDLQECETDVLRKRFGYETAVKLKDISFGKDTSAVNPTGKPKSIGLEDSCKPISLRKDVEERFRLLLVRLLEQVAEDGRIPICIKVILRKYDSQKKTSHRETKQMNILPSLFKSIPSIDSPSNAKVMLANGSQEKILKIIMRLFERVVDLNKPFKITLIGLAFTKFQQRKADSSSIANFLIKKTDLEVQSITCLTNTTVPITSPNSPTPSVSSINSDENFRSSPTTFQPSDQFYRRRTAPASPIPMLVDNGSESAATNSDFSDFSETEVEPSPKKSRIGRLLMSKRRCLADSSIYSSEASDVASPSKLRVCDLRLNSRDSEKDFPTLSGTSPIVKTSLPTFATTSTTSGGVQKFRTIHPLLVSNRPDICRPQMFSTRQNSKTPTSPPISAMDDTPSTPITLEVCSNTLASIQSINTSSRNLSNIPCPSGVDEQVFNELPVEVQNELIASWRSSLAAAAAAVANGHPPNQTQLIPTINGSSKTSPSAPTQKNTLYRYFLRNK